ncbi:MAG: hypothetical protein M1834_002639 [Cirrosporium novae-zelandiae]|nr:MAG: hypothetical protein M1834_002639 [Cirrosporium novae-zelandiae]
MALFNQLSTLCFLFFTSLSLASTVHFRIDLTWEQGAPDGNTRYLIFTNGQFPAPPLTLDYGDDVEFVVNNYMPFDTAVHFHGIEQIGTPWSDGVPGVSQKPIPTNGTFTYRWTATEYGQYWYHGHAQGQIQDGLYGSLLIRPPQSEPRPFSTIMNDNDNETLEAMISAEENPTILMLSDWDHLTFDEYLAAEADSGADLTCVDSILVNGQGSVNCQSIDTLESLLSAPLKSLLNGTNVTDRGCTPPIPAARTQGNFSYDVSKIPAGLLDGCTPTNTSNAVIEVSSYDGWASINFIAAASIKELTVSIDEHPMYVYAVDGAYIVPQYAESLEIYNGERYQALVKLDKPPGDYTIRVANNDADQILSGFATFRYQDTPTKTGASIPYIDYAGANTTADVVALDESQLVPFPPSKPAPTADATHILTLQRNGANYNWTLNGNASYPLTWDNNNPLLFSPQSDAAYDSSLVIRTLNDTWVDLVLNVLLSDGTPAQPAHPIHKHSNKGYIIGKGDGAFTWNNVAQAMASNSSLFNLETPQRRDSFTTAAVLQGPAWVAVRYHVENPGAFFIHCHMQTHLSGGMALALLDGVDAWPTIPDNYLNGSG